MGMPVVTVAAGGLPVVESTNGFGTPVTEATNGYGVAVTKVVGKPGLPVIFETIGIGPVLAPVTFDLATAVAVTLSGGNLTATNTGTTSANQGARVADAGGKTSGKFYYEMTITSGGNGANRAFGIGTTASTYTALGGSAATGSIVYHGSGNIWTNGGNSGSTLGAISLIGDVVGMAVDLDSRKIWFRKNAGIWNGSGAANPVTNVGGVAIPAGTMVPFCTFGGTVGTSGNSWIANFGQSAFAFSAPAGFGNWGV